MIPRSLLSLPLISACVACWFDPGYVAQTVHAATGGNPVSRRIPFLPPLNSRKSAKEAYLKHLQTELESAQKQLYVSQNTCTSLRQRWEEQRKETLGLLASKDRGSGVVDEESEQQFQQQKEEIERLENQLQTETEKHERQVERLDLMAAELKELQAWKEGQHQSNEGKILEYEQKLQESDQKQSDYADQVSLLALKLEAAEMAAKKSQEGRGDGKEAAWEQRAQELRSELEGVREKYSQLLISSLKASVAQGDGRGTVEQHKLEEEMDEAIQLAVELALESIEKGWEVKYEALENQLSNMAGQVASLEEERDAALSRAEEALASSAQSESIEEDSKPVEMQRKRLKDELSAELTESITDELTEKLTQQLTDTLAKKMERKYKKKYRRMQKELQEQQEKDSQREEAQEEVAQEQQRSLEAEIAEVKKQYEQEYETKLQELQRQSEEQIQLQKERMRKLVRALVEREAQQKGGKVEQRQERKKKSSSTKQKKIPETAGDEGLKNRAEDEEMVPTSSLASSRKRKRSRPGVVPVRGGNR